MAQLQQNIAFLSLICYPFLIMDLAGARAAMRVTSFASMSAVQISPTASFIPSSLTVALFFLVFLAYVHSYHFGVFL